MHGVLLQSCLEWNSDIFIINCLSYSNILSAIVGEEMHLEGWNQSKGNMIYCICQEWEVIRSESEIDKGNIPVVWVMTPNKERSM
jgi:hypothetical protein